MVTSGQSSTTGASGINPATSSPMSYINLPIVGGKQAPPKFKGHHRDLTRFLNRFEHVCTQFNVTESKQKCLGIIQYCSNSVADTIENLESYQKQDYNELVKDLHWFYDSERQKCEYHLGDLEDFIKEWRTVEVTNLETFKQYHREFVKVAGALKTAGQLEEKAFNRAFWAGLHPDTRKRIERRIMDDDPSYDLRNPFSVLQVTRAVEHVYNRNRFDKDLLEEERSRPRGSKFKKSSRRHRRKPWEDPDEDSDSEDESDEDLTPRWTPSRLPEKPKVVTPTKHTESAKGKPTANEIEEVTRKLERLHLDDREYRVQFARLYVLSPKVASLYPQPEMSPARRNPPPPRTRFEEAERSPRNLPQRAHFENMERPPLRDPPPHRTFTSEPQMGERRPMTCFGCGARGHRMDACEKIEAFIAQGTIQRIAGRLRWSDGSMIIREQEETWADAILRRVQGENKAKEGKKAAQDKGVYFVDVVRQDSDADSDDQEDLGWESATAAVHHLKSYGVDRPQKISRDARKTAQSNPPAHPHRMRQLPPEGNVKGPGRVEDPISHQKSIH